MKGIRILLPIILASVLTLGSCDNSLWYGGNKTAGLTLSLEFPPLPGTDTLSRALAFQGKHLYVEIAEILDEALYFDPNQDDNTDDSAFFNLVPGDGRWVSTPWGAHAVIHRDYVNTSSLTVSFSGVPTNRNLMLRVVQGTSAAVSDMGLEWYPGDSYPISQTFNESGSGPWIDMGVTITPAMLASGEIRIPIRPHPGTIWTDLNIDGSTPNSSSLLEVSGPPPFRSYNVGPGLPGQSEFSNVILDMGNGGSNPAPGMFVGIHIYGPDISAMPGRLDLYKQDGTRIPLTGGRNDPDEQNPGFSDRYRYYLVRAELDDIGGTNSGFFAGVTIFDDIDVGPSSPDYSTFNLDYAALTNTYVSSDYSFSFDGSSVSFQEILWELQFPMDEYNRAGELEYQVLHYWSGSLPAPVGDFLNYDYVMSLNPMIVLNWGSAESYFDDTEVPWYLIPNIMDIPGISISANEGDDFITVIAARSPGGEPFVIGTDFGVYQNG